MPKIKQKEEFLKGGQEQRKDWSPSARSPALHGFPLPSLLDGSSSTPHTARGARAHTRRGGQGRKAAEEDAGAGSQNGRPRPAKAETIHGLVRAGDLAGVQRMLRENPDLLNDKNPVVRALPASCAPYI